MVVQTCLTVNDLSCCLLSVTVSLEREALELHEAKANGLAEFVKKYNFIATFLMMCDILSHLANLLQAL